MYIICSDAGQPLREELARSPQKIISNAFSQFSSPMDGSSSQKCEEDFNNPISENFPTLSTNLAASSDGYFHGLYIISTLVKLMPAWLDTNRTVFETLLQAWKSPARVARLQNEQELSLLEVSQAVHVNFLSALLINV